MIDGTRPEVAGRSEVTFARSIMPLLSSKQVVAIRASLMQAAETSVTRRGCVLSRHAWSTEQVVPDNALWSSFRSLSH